MSPEKEIPDEYASLDVSFDDAHNDDDNPDIVDEEDELWKNITFLFDTLNELNEAIAYLTAAPESRESIAENKRYLKNEQLEFLNNVILSPALCGSWEKINATKAALEKAILMIFEEME